MADISPTQGHTPFPEDDHPLKLTTVISNRKELYQHELDEELIKEVPENSNIKEESSMGGGGLLDQSEDPCLNEGQTGNNFHPYVAHNNSVNSLASSNATTFHSSTSFLHSSYLKCLSHLDMGNPNGAIYNSPFASDNVESDNVHRWLELCDAAHTIV